MGANQSDPDMSATLDSHATSAAAQLLRRRQELLDLLSTAQAVPQDVAGVVDFKDIAARDVRAAIDDVTLAHAARELEDIAAALRRIDAGTYGTCRACGEAIDERRLHALPATSLCTACQADHERADAAH